MKGNDILKRYNANIILSNKAVNLFLFISIIIAISIALSIPQISINVENYWDKNAYSINGANLKIEVTYPLEAFDKKIEELKEDIEFRESKTFNTTVKGNGKEVYGDLIVGDYCTNGNEAILSANLAEILGVNKGDNIFIGEKEYKIIEIEKLSKGVGRQAGEMGYIKVCSFDSGEQEAYSKLLFVDQKDYISIEQDLKKIGKSYYYSTVEDVKKELIEKNSMNMLALNMLNTISIIMTIISIMSSIILIITKNKRDIAIMRTQSVHCKIIKNTFQTQFRLILYPAILIGMLLSIIIAKILLEENKMDFYMKPDIFIKVFLGMLLFGIVYNVYISIACKSVYKMRPMDIFRDEYQRIGYRGGVIKGIIFTLLVLSIYSVYVGNNNLFAGSVIVLFLIILFGIITFFFLKIITLIKTQNNIYKYTISTIKEKIYSTLIIILSLSFTALFVLIGFTLSNVVATSYARNLKSNLNYNYMLTTNDAQKVEAILKQTDNTGFYTKLDLRYGTLIIDSESKEKVSLCGIDKSQYYVKYNIIDGYDLFEGDSKKVIISDELSKEEKINLGDDIFLRLGKSELKYTVKGIYNSEGMNKEHILIDAKELSSDRQGFMYLAKIDKENVIENLKGVQIVDIHNVSSALEDGLQNVLKVFKGMCVICIILSLIFNANLVYIDALEQNKDFVIMRAIGIGKKQLKKHIFIKMFIIFILTLFLSVGNYCAIIYFAMKFIFDTKNPITLQMLLMPSGVAVLMLGIIFSIPFYKIIKLSNFDELHETV